MDTIPSEISRERGHEMESQDNYGVSSTPHTLDGIGQCRAPRRMLNILRNISFRSFRTTEKYRAFMTD